MVRALALRSGDPGFKTRSDLRPGGILNSCCPVLLSCFVFIGPEKPLWGVVNYVCINVCIDSLYYLFDQYIYYFSFSSGVVHRLLC